MGIRLNGRKCGVLAGGLACAFVPAASAAPIVTTSGNSIVSTNNDPRSNPGPYVPLPFIVAAGDLLESSTLVTANAVNSNNGAFRTDEGGASGNRTGEPNDQSGQQLTNGTFGPGDPDNPATYQAVVIGNGASLTYTLPAITGGYDITQIGSYTGWPDAGRDAQNYTVYTSTDGASFTPLARIDFDGPGGDASNTGAIITDSTGTLATGVTAVRFIFGAQHADDFSSLEVENNGVGYRELDVIGVPTLIPEPTSLALLGLIGAGLLGRRRAVRA